MIRKAFDLTAAATEAVALCRSEFPGQPLEIGISDWWNPENFDVPRSVDSADWFDACRAAALV